ncbi:hypothetical protein BJX66DRAFT_208471 [Aspergillus keveii]|jgi:hypothetical protein|uniref:Uncharacterized protein n=1 Tax=Aspergillus keveii TaxID=714993 RepID=A0ABR4G505_9EURO
MSSFKKATKKKDNLEKGELGWRSERIGENKGVEMGKGEHGSERRTVGGLRQVLRLFRV